MNNPTRGFPLNEAEPIAIVGMACNLPGDNQTPDDFWSFLLKKKSGIVEVPEDRWLTEVFYDPNPDAIAKSVSKWGGFIEDIRGFDAKFFGISPREAASMDPQQRLVLTGAIDAMMESQIPLEEFSRQRTGVFIGISQSEYRTMQEMRITFTESFAGTGYALCISANRISHRLNLNGPSYAIDTACSSSLTALNQAVHNLRAGTCDMAIVGGVNAIAHPSSFLAFSKAGMVSPTGQISTFDASANGFVRGEGAGTVIVKPYHKALADGDRIHAVIHATVANQDGATTTITAPSQAAQISMLRELFDSVDIAPEQIGFVEAHGTGTPIGDPIEAGAIGTVIGQQSPDRPIWVGSGKANIGHLESGAGIAGLIKTTLAVRNGTVPPNVNFKTPNPRIPFDALNLQVPVKPEPFPEIEGKRYAVVNSFGFGGSNACALVSSPPPPSLDHHPVPAAKRGATADDARASWPMFFPLSGATEEALHANAAALLKAMSGKGALSDVALPDLAAALATKRSHLMYRAVILARSDKELKKALRQLATGDAEAANIITGQRQNARKICFTFSGQGSQWWAMARDLLTHNETFAKAVDAFDADFQPVAGWSIKQELLKDEAESRINDTTVTQPALFAIQSGLAAVWRAFGVEPDMVVGHSIGEAAASYVANGLSLSGAAKFLSKRGVIRDQLGAHGAMAAIGLHHDDVVPLLPDHGKLGIAAINGPGSTTISGDYDALHDFVDEFQMMRPDTFIRALTVDTAWHSYHLDAGEDWFRKEMARIDWSVPTIPWISTVTAKPETRFDTDYGWLNLRRPVNFKGAIETAVGMGATTFVELGPAATLAGPTKSTALELGAGVSVLNSINRKESDFDVMARTAAELFVQGCALDWAAISGMPSRSVDLPGYAWQLEEFWQDSEESRAILYRPVKHPFLGQEAKGNGTVWHSEINLKAYAYLKDHRMQADVIFPAAGYLDTIFAMGRQVFGADKVLEIEDAVIHEALFVNPDDVVMLSVVYEPDRGKVGFYSRLRDGDDDWVLRCEARIRTTDAAVRGTPRPFDAARKGLTPVDVGYAYDVDTSSNYVNYGEAFQTIEDLWMTPSKTMARIALRDAAASGKERYHAHPTMLDGCLQILEPRMTLKRVRRGRRPDDPVVLPIGVGRIRVFADFPDEIFVEADQIKETEKGESTAGLTVRDADGNVLMTIENVRVRIIDQKMTEAEGEEVPAHFVRQDIVELREDPDANPILGTWMLLEGGSAHDDALAKALADVGAEVRRVPRADLGDDPREGLTDVAADAIEDGALAGIVVAWPLAMPRITESTPTPEMFAPIDACAQDMIALGDLMDYARTGENGLPEIVILTSGAYPRADGETSAAILSQMPMAAVARGLATETPEYKVRVIDSDTAQLAAPADLARRVLTPSTETEVILRDGAAFAPRLHRAEVDDFNPKLLTVSDDDTSTNFHATMQSPGVIDNVGLFEIPLEPMGPGQVRVRIGAVGLNFRDIMAVTGLLPAEAEVEPAWQNLGLEFGGVVEAVGDEVSGFKPGDRVMGMGKRCLQRFMTVDPIALTKLPDGVSLAEAATIPSAFATAHYALNRVGRMRKGEKVFIHVATGGVGTAAVQLAQAAGAEIFATAGSPAKRKLLRDLGVDHVMDSRSLKFADDVMKITSGGGVDLLLNSLPGDYITRGLDIMAPYGRFLEIGKRDVYEDSSFGLKALRRNVSLSVLDLAAMGSERPDLMAEMMQDLVEMLDAGKVSPLPVTAFPANQISDAIRYMSQAKHVGKVVVTLDDDAVHVRRDTNRPVALAKDGTYLVTGGTAGFTLSIAEWLSQAGAGHLVLASRSGRMDDAGERLVEKLRARGTKVSVAALDITDSDAVDTFVGESLASDMPLRGVVHGAAVIKDGFANQLTPEMITEVLSPKIRGAWNLHRAFAANDVKPDFLIGFSSISQVTGSAGQSNYIIANAFLDALAHYRQSNGLAGAAIDWGVIADAGFVARNDALASYLESVGMHGLRRHETGAAMELAISREAPSFVYSRADWPQAVRANPALGPSPRMTSVLAADSGGTQEVRARLMQLEDDELVDAARDYIMDEITNVLKIDRSTIQVERPMSELGLDSLSSFELKIRIETALDYSLPVSKFLQAPSVKELSKMVASEIEGIRRAEASEGGDTEGDSTAGSGATAERGPRASNLQMGLRREALSRFTSAEAHRAMETRAGAVLPDGVSPDELRRAIAKLTRRHPMLSLRLTGDGKLGLDGAGPALVEEDDATPLDLAGQEYVRFTIRETEAGPWVEIRLHKVAGDAASCQLLLGELLALVKGESLDKAVPKRAVLAAIDACNYDPETPSGQTDQAFWWYNLASGAAPVPFAGRSRPVLPPGGGRDHGTADHVTRALPDRAGEAAALQALAGALRAATRTTGPVLVGRRVSTRGALPAGAAVGPFEIEQPLLVSPDRDDRIATARLRRMVAAADRHRAYDSHAAAEELAGRFEDWGSSPFQVLFEPVSSLDAAAPDATLHDLWVQLDIEADRPSFRLVFDRDVIAPDMANRIADAMVAALGTQQPATSDAPGVFAE